MYPAMADQSVQRKAPHGSTKEKYRMFYLGGRKSFAFCLQDASNINECFSSLTYSSACFARRTLTCTNIVPAIHHIHVLVRTQC